MMQMTKNRIWLSAGRGAGLGLLTTTGTAILSWLLAQFAIDAALSLGAPATGAGSVTDLEAFLAAALTGSGALVAAWYALSGSVGTCCTLARALGGTWRAGEVLLRRRGAPGVARLVGAGTGAVLTAGLVLAPAQAEPPEPTPEPTVAEDLTWASAAAGSEQSETEAEADQGPAEAPAESSAPAEAAAEANASAEAPSDTTTPTEALDEPSTSTEAPSEPSASAEAPNEPAAGDYVVEPGDTLWAIAAAHLDSAAPATRIATAWPQWYEANRAAIGPEPDLILPGTVLHEPD